MNTKSPFFPRDYSCPVCMASFSSLSVRSSSVNVVRRETDFHTVYRGINPLHYSIVVCPSCEYAAPSQRFSDPLQSEQVQELSRALMQLKIYDRPDYCMERDVYTALQCFRLAVRSAQLKKASKGELAGLLLSTAWIADEAGESDLELAYRREALKCYIEAYNHESAVIGNLSDLQVGYLIGELFRRDGDLDEAITWFSKVVFHPDIKKHPSVEKGARDQWALAREQAQSSQHDKNKVSAYAEAEKPIVDIPQTSAAAVKKAAASSMVNKQINMQMPLHLSFEQLDWLNQVGNNKGDTAPLITREQVLRALLSAAMSCDPAHLPRGFSGEEELEMLFAKMFAIRDTPV